MKAFRKSYEEWRGTKEEAKKVEKAFSYYWEGKTYYCRHGEYRRPEYKAVRSKKEWIIRKTSFVYPGTILKGELVQDGIYIEYLNVYQIADIMERILSYKG